MGILLPVSSSVDHEAVHVLMRHVSCVSEMDMAIQRPLQRSRERDFAIISGVIFLHGFVKSALNARVLTGYAHQ